MVNTYGLVCPVLFGDGAVEKLGEKIKGLGASKVLCVYDQGVKLAGISDKVLTVLKDEGVETVVYDKVQADPADVIVDEAAQTARLEQTEAVVGIGGGSSLDVAKAVAVLLKNPGEIGAYYTGGQSFSETAPLILVPTTSGTGSEVTPMAVITDTKNQVKQTVLSAADLAVVDPELTLTVPAHVTVMTGFDVLSHAVEAYTANSSYGNPMSDVLAEKAMELVSKNLETAYLDSSDQKARNCLSMASNFAGIAFAASSVHIGHAAAHELGAKFHIPHGALCALTLPVTMRFVSEAMPEKIKGIAKAMQIYLPEGTESSEAAEIVAEELKKRMKKMQIKSLKEYGIKRDEVISCAKGAVDHNWFVICAPEKIDEPVMEEYLGQMYDDYV